MPASCGPAAQWLRAVQPRLNLLDFCRPLPRLQRRPLRCGGQHHLLVRLSPVVPSIVPALLPLAPPAAAARGVWPRLGMAPAALPGMIYRRSLAWSFRCLPARLFIVKAPPRVGLMHADVQLGRSHEAFRLPGVDHDKREGKWWRFEGDEA